MKPTPIKNTFRGAVTLTLILVITGCLSPRMFSNKIMDVTNSPAWWGNLAKNEMLRLKQDILLNDNILTLSANKFTDDYNSAIIYGRNISVEAFKANPDKYWPELHLLPKGTRLKCVKLLRVFSFETSYYEVEVEILDAEFKGHVVSLGGFTSGLPDKKGSLTVNTNFLETI